MRVRLRLAYLTNQYPAISHTFVRRELHELERRGHSITRLSIRRADSAPVDPEDLEEAKRTFTCLSQPPHRLLLSTLKALVHSPAGFCRGAALAWRMCRRSDRGLVRHIAYLIEAAAILDHLKRERVEHLHVHFGTNAAAVARLVRRMGGPTYSMVCHGPVEWDEPRQLDIGGKVADAEFVTAISSFASAQVRRWADPSHWHKIHVVRCTVSEAYLRPEAGSHPIDPACRTLVCVGRLAGEKGQTLLIDAFAKAVQDGGGDMHGATLVLVGDGPLRPTIERRARELGIADRVELAGWMAEQEVRRRMLQSRALVLPSFGEGLPVVIMESLALCRPVLAAYIAGIPELVVPGENGWLVPAGDVPATAAAIREILRTPADRLDAMGQAGRRAVLERHNPRTEVDRLEALLLERAGRGG